MDKSAAAVAASASGMGRQFGSSVTHVAAPVLIGLIGSVVATLLIAPAAIKNGHLLATVMLIPMLLGSVAIYTWSVLNPGKVVGLMVDTELRTLDLIQSNSFAERRTRLGFSDISDIAYGRPAAAGDSAPPQTALHFRDGETLPLAINLDEGNVAELRRLLGLEA
jgi:uncharacterized membrane protein YeaQ/YmgE (transglycosylase-associated protein family)